MIAVAAAYTASSDIAKDALAEGADRQTALRAALVAAMAVSDEKSRAFALAAHRKHEQKII